MKTAAERVAAGLITVDEGWVILRDDRRLEDKLYSTRQAAETTAQFFVGSTVAPAKRVWSFPHKRSDWIIGGAA